jgi:hypothetical protein
MNAGYSLTSATSGLRKKRKWTVAPGKGKLLINDTRCATMLPVEEN